MTAILKGIGASIFGMPMGRQEIESRKYESTFVNLGTPGYFGAVFPNMARLARAWVGVEAA